MDLSLSQAALASFTTRQLNTFFPDPNAVDEGTVARLLPAVLHRLEQCLSGLREPLFRRQGTLHFNHLHSDQYSMFLYLLANEAHHARAAGDAAAKSYLLNKALHGVEAFYEVALPTVFWLGHALGSVLGRARYGNGLLVAQNCTIGNKAGKYPSFGEKVILCANSTVLGESVIGSRVCIGAGALLIDVAVPDHCTVVGRGPDVRILAQESPMIDTYFSDILPEVNLARGVAA